MRFMHIADVHLGAAPDHGYVWSKDRGRELWETFRQCIADAKEKKVDLLLIAGDLFHRQPEPRELKEVNYLFSTLENTAVVLMAGNHDYLAPGSPYRGYPWNENVVCMFSRECERVRLPELKTEIYGFSYYEQEIPLPLYDNIAVKKMIILKFSLRTEAMRGISRSTVRSSLRRDLTTSRLDTSTGRRCLSATWPCMREPWSRLTARISGRTAI
ncbi:MAG: metallophosphoesterase [Lachnospiraceae bacterium]|nr:metallophosphoesterase [Lachnospiraceae bacterium]